MEDSVDISRYATTVEHILIGYIVIGVLCAFLVFVYALKKNKVSGGMAAVFAAACGAFWPMTLLLIVRKSIFGKEIPSQPAYRKPWERFGK